MYVEDSYKLRAQTKNSIHDGKWDRSISAENHENSEQSPPLVGIYASVPLASLE